MITNNIQHFEQSSILVDGVRLNILHSGSGQPLLLLHGFPQTSHAWRKVAPELAKKFHVIVPDLPGYGESVIDDIDSFDFSKRNVGNVLLKAVDELSEDSTVYVAGHDRGARVAFRLGFDHANRIGRLIVIGSLPVLDIAEATNWQSAHRAYHWFLLSQQHPIPEKIIGDSVDIWIRHLIEHWSGDVNAIEEQAIAEYIASFKKPNRLRAACEDYRASFGVDLEQQRFDREQNHILERPILLINPALHAVAAERRRTIWSKWTNNLEVCDLRCGHFAMEEKPGEVVDAINTFLSAE